MKRSKVISYKNLPARPPFVFTAVVCLMLDRAHAVGWVWGASGVLVLFVWAAYIHGLLTEELVDLFKTKGPNQ